MPLVQHVAHAAEILAQLKFQFLPDLRSELRVLVLQLLQGLLMLIDPLQKRLDGGDADERWETEIPQEWIEEFQAAAQRPLSVRFRYAFIRTYKPVLDDATYRAFDTMEDYCAWCEENLPEWLGYGRI